jgi:DNA-directed RNA polymerase specialized sigma24 family protein
LAAAGISIATLLRMSGAGAADDPALELYARYGAQLFRFCRRLAADADNAEDAVQATVLEAARLLAAGFRPEFESAWLFSLAQRLATDGATRPARKRVSALAEELREPLALRLEGRTYAEIAETLGVARGAIELRILRARIAAQPRRSIRFGDLASLGGALKALLAGGAAVPATVAAVGAVAVVPRVVHRDHAPAHSVPAVVAPKSAPAPVVAAPLRDSAAAATPAARRVAAHPARAFRPATRPAPAHPRPAAAAAPVATPSPSPSPAPAASQPAADAPGARQPPSAPASEPAADPASAPAPVSAPVQAPVAVSEPVPAPAPPVPALEPVTSSPVVSDPVGTITTVVDQAVAAAPALPVTAPALAAPPLPKLP